MAFCMAARRGRRLTGKQHKATEEFNPVPEGAELTPRGPPPPPLETVEEVLALFQPGSPSPPPSTRNENAAVSQENDPLPPPTPKGDEDQPSRKRRARVPWEDPSLPSFAAGPAPPGLCWGCRRIGHTKRDCPEPNWIPHCFRCGWLGRSLRDCPQCGPTWMATWEEPRTNFSCFMPPEIRGPGPQPSNRRARQNSDFP